MTCFDTQRQITRSGQQACYVQTLRGIKARERLTEACKAHGQAAETCLKLAVKQLTAHLPTKSH